MKEGHNLTEANTYHPRSDLIYPDLVFQIKRCSSPTFESPFSETDELNPQAGKWKGYVNSNQLLAKGGYVPARTYRGLLSTKRPPPTRTFLGRQIPHRQNLALKKNQCISQCSMRGPLLDPRSQPFVANRTPRGILDGVLECMGWVLECTSWVLECTN